MRSEAKTTKWMRVAASATALGVLSGCTSVDFGLPVRDPNHDPLTVNTALLDPGPFSTEVRPLGRAGSFDAGRRLESDRLGEYVVNAAQVEPSLLKGAVGYPGASGSLTEQTNRLREYFNQSEIADAVNRDDVVAGFGFKNEVKESYSYSSGVAVLRFNAPSPHRPTPTP